MRSSTVATIATALLSIHGAAALNHRRYSTTLATHTIAATQAVYRRHGQEDENRGGGKDRDDGGEYGFGGNYEDDKPELTPSKSKSIQSVTVTVSEEPTGVGSKATPVEESSTDAASSPVPSGKPAAENKEDASTSDIANLETSGGADGNANGMQLSFVPTTIFATGEAPTVTITAAPRTITQVQACEAAAPSSTLASAESVTITVTQSASQQEAPPASTITITESAPQQPLPEPVTMTVTETAAPQPALEQLTITQQQFVTQTTTIHAYATGIEQIDAVLPEGAKSTMLSDNQNQGEYAKTTLQTLAVLPTPSSAGEYGTGSDTAGEGGQCQCACPCESKEFTSTRFPVIPGTPPVDASMPEETGADEPTTTVRLEVTETTLQTIIMSGTLEAPAATTTTFEEIELDPAMTAAPIIIASSAFDEPVISSIPVASFGQGETTPGVIRAGPIATASESIDTSIALDISSSAAVESSSTSEAPRASAEETAPFFTTTLDAPLSTPEIGAIPKSEAGGDQAGVDTLTIASSIIYETAVITPSSLPAEETASFFTTTLDAPLATPEIGAIPADRADDGAQNSEADTEIVLATSTIASSTATATSIVTPSPVADEVNDEEVAPVFTTTIDAPLETPEIGAIPKEEGGQAGEVLQGEKTGETPTSVEPEAPSQTNAQVAAVATKPMEEAAAGGGDEEVDINMYTLSSKIELGNMG